MNRVTQARRARHSDFQIATAPPGRIGAVGTSRIDFSLKSTESKSRGRMVGFAVSEAPTKSSSRPAFRLRALQIQP
jgi:hypothetical protein